MHHLYHLEFQRNIPREVTVYEERDGGWIRIHTDTGFKWVCLVEKKVNMNKNF